MGFNSGRDLLPVFSIYITSLDVHRITFVSSSADLQNAIEIENYTLAAELRDEISKLEADSLAASVRAQAYENAQYTFRLGQRVRHKIFGTVCFCLSFL